MRKKTLTLRSAESFREFGRADGGPGSLGAVLEIIHAQFTTIQERRAAHEGKVIECRNTQNARGGIKLLHLVAYTPDDPVSVVPDAPNETAAALALVNPPRGTEFLDGELMLLIRDNDVLVCRDRIGHGPFQSYVMQLSERAHLDPAAISFMLMKRWDIDKLAIIHQQGVKRLSLDALAYQASVDHLERTSLREKIVGQVWDEVAAILGIDHHIPEDAENLKVEVLLSFDKRRGTALDQRQLAALAMQVVDEDEDEGFKIETLDNQKFRGRDVVISKLVELQEFGKSVDHRDAWAALINYYRELREPR